jgi:hypothetical protein
VAVVEHGEGLSVASLHEGHQVLVCKEQVLSELFALIRHAWCILRERRWAGSSLPVGSNNS